MAEHTAHPKCPGCNKALYKAMEKGAKVSVSDPYAFCRNPQCRCWGYRPDEEPEGDPPPPSSLAAPEPGPLPPPSESPARRARREGLSRPEAPLPEGEGEPIPVVMARARLSRLVHEEWSANSAAAIGLTLALLSQETGNQEAANVLIAKYDLHERFGIQMFAAPVHDDGLEDNASTE